MSRHIKLILISFISKTSSHREKMCVNIHLIQFLCNTYIQINLSKGKKLGQHDSNPLKKQHFSVIQNKSQQPYNSSCMCHCTCDTRLKLFYFFNSKFAQVTRKIYNICSTFCPVDLFPKIFSGYKKSNS